MRIDVKSALLGLAAGALLAFGAAASSGSGATVGRYQIAITGDHAGSHGLILDTATGQVWSGYFPASGRSDEGFCQPKAIWKK